MISDWQHLGYPQFKGEVKMAARKRKLPNLAPQGHLCTIFIENEVL